MSQQPSPHAVEVYKQTETVALKAYLFYPETWQPGDHRPVFVYLHGGSFQRGSPETGYDLAAHFARLGLVAMSVQYRLSSDQATVDMIIADVRSAVRWIRQSAAELGADPEKVSCMGASAGGRLAASIALLSEQNNDQVAESAVPNALILVAASFDPDNEGFLVVLPERADPDVYSPINYIRAGLPPTLVVHGLADQMISPTVSEDFAAKMQAAGNRSELYLLEGADHFFREPLYRRQLIARVEAFLQSLGYITG